jgi:hypothetical protein
MQNLSVFSGLLNIITVLTSKLYGLNCANGTQWRLQDGIAGRKSTGISQNWTVITVFELLIMHGRWEVV